MTGCRQRVSLRVQVSPRGAILGRPGRVPCSNCPKPGSLEKRNPLFHKLLHYEILTSQELEFQTPPAR